MKLYYAPLEGIAGYIYRNAFHEYFGKGHIDKYFSPFIAPGVNQVLSLKEMRDILPENNKVNKLVPQLLGSRGEDILLAIKRIKEFGYDEVNINLGCPSGTVVAKKKGSGLLYFTEELDKFLYTIFEDADVKVSIKTRLGKESPEEFYEILDIYNKYEMEELIIHPRIRSDFYKNSPNLDMYEYAYKNSKNVLCYNGDIIDGKKYDYIKEKFPNTDKVMIGRGFLRNPGLVFEICEGSMEYDKEKLMEFHDRLLNDYSEYMSGEKPVLFKMKELWSFMSDYFVGFEKELKKIKKSQKLSEYKVAAKNIIINK